jgi:hypothetical protein
VLWAGLSRWGKYCWGPVGAGHGRAPNVDRLWDAFLRRMTVNRKWRGQQRRPAVAAREGLSTHAN